MFLEITVNPDSSLSFEEQRLVNRQLSNIILLYLRHLPIQKVGSIRKVKISLTDNQASYIGILPYKKGQSAIFLVEAFDFTNYLNLTDEKEKIKRVILTILNGVKEVAKSFDWDIFPFEDAFKSLENSRFANELELLRRKSKDNKHFVGINVVLNLNETIVKFIFEGINSPYRNEVEIVRILPGEYPLNKIVGTLKWLNETDVELMCRSIEVSFIGSLNRSNIEVVYHPGLRGHTEIEIELKILLSTIEQDTREDLLLELRKSYERFNT